MPILVRKDTLCFFPEVSDNPKETEIFQDPAELGIEVVDTKLSAIVCPHVGGKDSFLVREDDPIRKLKKLAILANAHRLKFCQNGLDRNDGFKDNNQKIELIDYTTGLVVPEGLVEIPYYDAFLKNSKDVVRLLDKEGI